MKFDIKKGQIGSKKTDVSEFNSISEILPRMICTRYHGILKNAKDNSLSIRDFEIIISSEVRKFISWKCRLTDDELRAFYNNERQKNNRKFNSYKSSIRLISIYYMLLKQKHSFILY